MLLLGYVPVLMSLRLLLLELHSTILSILDLYISLSWTISSSWALLSSTISFPYSFIFDLYFYSLYSLYRL